MIALLVTCKKINGMRKIYYTLPIFLCSFFLYSQDKKIDVGVAFDMDFLRYNKTDIYRMEPSRGYSFGASSLYKYSEKLFFQADFLYSIYTKKIITEKIVTNYGTEGAIKLPVSVNYYISKKNNLFVGGGVEFVIKPDYNDSYEISDGDDFFILRNVTDKEFFIHYKLKAGYVFTINKSKLTAGVAISFMPDSMDQNVLEYRDELFKYDMAKVYYSLGLRYHFL